MFQLLLVSPKIPSNADAAQLKILPKNAEISFNNVSFEYQHGQQILNNLSFAVPPGKSYAIVGGKLVNTGDNFIL